MLSSVKSTQAVFLPTISFSGRSSLKNVKRNLFGERRLNRNIKSTLLERNIVSRSTTQPIEEIEMTEPDTRIPVTVSNLVIRLTAKMN